MKQLNKYIKLLLIFTGCILILISCSQETPLQANLSESADQNAGLMKKKNNGGKKDKRIIDVETIDPDNGSDSEDDKEYAEQSGGIQISSGIVYYSKKIKHYIGTIFGHPNGSAFTVLPFSLTPPEGATWGENVTLTMKVEKDLKNGRLTYSFGPSGCSFEPAADLWISWEELGVNLPDLFYLNEDNQYIKQSPEDVDYVLKRVKVKIKHFSRYAIAYSD